MNETRDLVIENREKVKVLLLLQLLTAGRVFGNAWIQRSRVKENVPLMEEVQVRAFKQIRHKKNPEVLMKCIQKC